MTQGHHGKFLAGKAAIVAATSRCFQILKILPRTKPWLPCLPWRPWFKLIGILVGIPMLPDFSNRKVEGAEGIF